MALQRTPSIRFRQSTQLSSQGRRLRIGRLLYYCNDSMCSAEKQTPPGGNRKLQALFFGRTRPFKEGTGHHPTGSDRLRTNLEVSETKGIRCPASLFRPWEALFDSRSCRERFQTVPYQGPNDHFNHDLPSQPAKHSDRKADKANVSPGI